MCTSCVLSCVLHAFFHAFFMCSFMRSSWLAGGGVRMPRVKKTLDEYFKSSKIELGQHLNGTYVL